MVNNNYDNKNIYFNNLSKSWDAISSNDEARIKKLTSVFSWMNIKKGDTVLDAGCGTGILFPIIEDYIGSTGRLIALDASSGMIEVAQSKYKHFNNIIYIAVPLENIVMALQSVNVIICFAVFPHIEDKLLALKKCHDLLADDGSLYIFHLSDTKTLNEFHSNLNAPVSKDFMPYKDELEQLLLDAGFFMKHYIDEPELNFIHAVLQ
ncbi:MAG: class I SAM-dependent methyltransferase [Spirochaetes bacterium]|nr:class I SAM-dependent methyltransferase [Spirochaetota bacterium]HQL43050.1 class I SAM-dependent methyltransferase [Spirochaetota bacterium]